MIASLAPFPSLHIHEALSLAQSYSQTFQVAAESPDEEGKEDELPNFALYDPSEPGSVNSDV